VLELVAFLARVVGSRRSSEVFQGVASRRRLYLVGARMPQGLVAWIVVDQPSGPGSSASLDRLPGGKRQVVLGGLSILANLLDLAGAAHVNVSAAALYFG